METLQGQKHPACKPAVQETGDISAKDRILTLSLILLSQARALLTSKPSVHLEREGESSVHLSQIDSRSIFPLGFFPSKDSAC